MDQYTYKELDGRINGLELQLGIDNEIKKSSNDTVISQLTKIQKKLNKFYDSNAELETLNRIISDLQIWDKIKQSPTELPSNKSTDKGVSNELTIDMKQKLVLMKYPAIKEAYNNLIQLSNMDIPKLINYIETSQDKSHNFNSDNYELLQRKQIIQDITNNFHLLVMKNMIVFEKYLNLMVRENKYWVSIDEQVQALRRKLLKVENNRNVQNKY
ncbi:uncharacterized protein AC631_05537 [Debaryomyces fabryi]|uniref:Uncharacterized protein n=1 Tax=Debaryomyces fabryi TaxID=58627 RepID=A0A0V1PR34_9ASCO|nr:uncharacterized protein AC631_05537 [Debaryomyces fabryi]KRZ98695.1 hypothetical protein AC631_05537 [Debaryomyces fabryi]CUM56491.1 unnamed protein product [Debaryomyces fabryi]